MPSHSGAIHHRVFEYGQSPFISSDMGTAPPAPCGAAGHVRSRCLHNTRARSLNPIGHEHLTPTVMGVLSFVSEFCLLSFV